MNKFFAEKEEKDGYIHEFCQWVECNDVYSQRNLDAYLGRAGESKECLEMRNGDGYILCDTCEVICLNSILCDICEHIEKEEKNGGASVKTKSTPPFSTKM